MSIATQSNGLARNGNGSIRKPLERFDFDPTEIRRLVKVGVERGLMTVKAPAPVVELEQRRPAKLSSRVKPNKSGVAAPVRKCDVDLTRLGDVRSQWMEVGPEQAKAWLKNNFGNRRVSEDLVRAYARDMLNGVWVPTHQGIAFNDKDELIDGQHRLQAVVVANMVVRMMVTFGLPSLIKSESGASREMTTMDAVDRGRTRSVADQLSIQHGMSNGSITAAICAALASLCFGERTRRLSVGQTLDVFRAFEPAVLYVIEHRCRDNGLRTTGVLAGFAFALVTENGFWERPHAPAEEVLKTRKNVKPEGREGEGPIARMFSHLNTGEGIEADAPMGKLRAFLTSDEAKLFTRSLDRGLAELVLQSIYQEAKGLPAGKLETALDGLKHFTALQRERVEKVAAMFRIPSNQA